LKQDWVMLAVPATGEATAEKSGPGPLAKGNGASAGATENPQGAYTAADICDDRREKPPSLVGGSVNKR